MLFNAVVSSNALLPISVTVLGIVTDSSDVQPRNATELIFLTPSAITTFLRFVQFWKPSAPSTVAGIVTDSRPVQFLKHADSIVLRYLGNFIVFTYFLFPKPPIETTLCPSR